MFSYKLILSPDADKLPGCGRILRPHNPAFAEVSGMLTNQKITDAINEPAFAGATAWQADHFASG
jgi:hypothetical protein